MELIERMRRAAGILPAKVDDAPMGENLGKNGKTITRWRKDMVEAGAPPLMEEDESFTLKSQEDWDTVTEYFQKIADPRGWRQAQKRRQQDSE
jgi:hypothetical protein